MDQLYVPEWPFLLKKGIRKGHLFNFYQWLWGSLEKLKILKELR